MDKKTASNPFLSAAATPFSLSDSFGGAQPALLVPTATSATPTAPPAAVADAFNLSSLPPLPTQPPSATPTPSLSTVSSASSLSSMANQYNANQAAPPTSAAVAPPPMVSSLGPPPPGVFILPSAGATSSAAPSVSAPPPPSNPLSGGSALRSRYVAPPGILSSGGPSLAPGGVPAMPTSAAGVPGMNPSPSMPTLTPAPSAAPATSASPFMPPAMTSEASAYAPISETSAYKAPGTKATPLEHHWFYQVVTNKQEQWKPFSMVDSMAIEEIFSLNPSSAEPVATDGGRYDVNIAERTKMPVFWKQDPQPIRRCSWFYKSNVDGRWIPYDETIAGRLESEYSTAASSGKWSRRLELEADEYIILHSPSAMMHFPSSASGNGAIDDWGQVQPRDPQLKPRVVHRGLEGLPDIPGGETAEVDHLVFMVHGIGSACDIRFRKINEVVDGYRDLTGDLSERHYQSAHLSGRANRVEFLPVNWHETLHGRDMGTDSRLKPLTLKSIPKMRDFMNDTLLDILFYTSPAYCQTICNTVVSEINRMYTLFMARNEGFKGKISLIGHSLGSLILFDVLSNQSLNDAAPTSSKSSPSLGSAPVLSQATFSPAESNWGVEEIFAHLSLVEFLPLFTKDAIDIDTLMMCSEGDLEEQGLPLEQRKRLIEYLNARRSAGGSKKGDGLHDYQKSSVESDVKYLLGPNGLGQPMVDYPQLCFEPAAFYAFGSPISMFLAVRGISNLGPDFHFPACPRFFNIFHPFDPVAYRMEAIISPDYEKLRPVVIPHHMGRKRMHLELKDTVTKLMTTDIKQKIIDSVSSTLATFYNIATGTSSQQTSDEDMQIKAALEDSMSKKAAEDDEADARNPRTLHSKLNGGNRIDFVLQEAPLESFNEYLFALASHLCYWESEDSCLMVLRDIYEQMGIYSDDANTLMLPRTQSAPGGFVPPPTEPQVPTAILRPPPIPMGGSMAASKPSESTTPIMRPPPTPMGGTMQGPPVLQTSATGTPILAPPSVVPMLTPSSSATLAAPGVQTHSSTPIAPATLFTTPSPVMPPVMPARPPASSFGNPVAPSGMGMDPTAPIDPAKKPVGPPPMMGFVQKK